MLVHNPTADEWMRSRVRSKNTPRRAKGQKSNAEPEAA
jgi:hypothetical protein